MKITKRKPVKANTEVITTEETVDIQPLEPPCKPCKYDEAIALISAAIENLAVIAKDDEIAKDSIANLGVVMLDLKSQCC